MSDPRNHNEYSELAWLFALGVLDGDDLRDFERHLIGCAECRAQLREAEAATSKLAYTTAATEPPIELRARVQNRISAQTRPSSHVIAPHRAWWPRLAVSFGVAALLLALAGWYKALSLNRQVLALQIQMRDMESQLTRQMAQLALFRAPASEVLALAGQPVAADAKGKMIWDPQTGYGLFVAAGLPPAPSDKTYQLWVIADGAAISAGVFAVDPRGAGELDVSRLPALVSIQAFAVTLEPAGGVPQPTGEKYLIGLAAKS